MHAILLHCFGQDIFIKATNKQYGRSNNNWHRAFTELTELDIIIELFLTKKPIDFQKTTISHSFLSLVYIKPELVI